MTIDTEIRHVTKPGANLFLELGFSAEEAKRLQTASHKQINDTRQLKEQLMSELADWIEQHHLRQADAAQILMVSRLRVSDVVKRKRPNSRSIPWSRCSAEWEGLSDWPSAEISHHLPRETQPTRASR